MPAAAAATKLKATIVTDHPTLVVGSRKFICTTDKLPFGTLLKYSENDLDLVAIKRLLTKVIDPDDMDDVFDAFDEVGVDGSSEAIKLMIEQFTERPTRKP